MSLTRENLTSVFSAISAVMHEHRDYLIGLDQQNGDGDLGISMDEGYRAVAEYLKQSQENDLGKLFMQIASVFNESAPSSLGTITAFGLMGIAKSLKGKSEANLSEVALALQSGVERIMEKAKSKPGEKTILDSLHPAVQALAEQRDSDAETAFKAASEAARSGAESTKAMRSVHGRAAYYGDKSIGLLDGGAEVGRLLFEAIYQYCSK
ncbi:dihydroxyacetone kinase subunit L [Sphaerochaeta sp. UBA5836]|uniref:dihydroxyacetone kinase subunit L n=1 Tax=Sphaerochaeta sp. UBA5836 TaxID=1947474 RepID=UPI0025ECEB47|nr:dihydroxyacetone kinase subunit L [Sphaerochaeta sp. UBA5836]